MRNSIGSSRQRARGDRGRRANEVGPESVRGRQIGGGKRGQGFGNGLRAREISGPDKDTKTERGSGSARGDEIQAGEHGEKKQTGVNGKRGDTEGLWAGAKLKGTKRNRSKKRIRRGK